MKKLLILTIMSILLLQFVAADLIVTKTSLYSTIAKELNSPARYLVNITNDNPSSTTLKLYSLLDINVYPTEKITIAPGDSKEIQVEYFFGQSIKEKYTGSNAFAYEIDGYQDSSDYKKEDSVRVDILPLSQIIDLKLPEQIGPEDTSMKIVLNNKYSIRLENIKVEIVSPYTTVESDPITLDKYESKEISLPVTQDDIKKTRAGFNPLTFEISVDNEASYRTTKEMFVRELKEVKTETTASGNFLYKKIEIKKINTGNVRTSAIAIYSTNKIASWFTSFSVSPDNKENEKKAVYTWSKDLDKGETFTVDITINFVKPLIILVVILFLFIIVNRRFRNKIIIRKKAVKIRTNTGRFALKMMLYIKAKEDVRDVTILDRIPPLGEIHEKFNIAPDAINHKSGRMEWGFDILSKGEERMITYIVTSRVGILGKFSVPQAIATYKDGNSYKKSVSNKVFFLSSEHY